MSWVCLRCDRSCVGTRFCSTNCSKEYVYEKNLICSKSECKDRRNYMKQVLLHYCEYHNQYNVESLGSYIETTHNKNLLKLRAVSAQKIKNTLQDTVSDKQKIFHHEHTIKQLRGVNTKLKKTLKSLNKRQRNEDPLKDVMVTVSQPGPIKKSRYYEMGLDEFLANAKPTL